MKILLFTYFLTGIIYLAYLFLGAANAQYFEDPKKYFQKFEFDMMSRGLFNISQCMKDLLTCYELVNGEVICSYGIYSDTACITIRNMCNDFHEEFDDYRFNFEISEEKCLYKNEDWT